MVSHDIAVESGTGTGAGAEDGELCALLRSYREVMSRADALPTLLWMRTRPPGSSPLGRWWRLPRLTWGVSFFVLYHVSRSTDQLARAYAGRAAVGELDDRGRQERQMLADFRESLPTVRWRWLVVVVAAAIVMLGRPVVEQVAVGLPDLTFGAENVGLLDEQREALREAMDSLATAASSLSVSSIPEFVDQLGEADVTGILVLLAGLVLAGYVVLRPASAPFRVKRVLFNLADEPGAALRGTTSTWHVPRAVGLYERESRVLRAAGALHRRRERPLDLALSLVITLIVGWALISLYLSDLAQSRSGRLSNAMLVLPFVVARLVWLEQTYRARKRRAQKWQPPTGAVLPATGRVVDVRQGAEAAALSASFLYPVVWYRLARQTVDARAERAEQTFGDARRVPRWALLPTAAMSLYLWPVMMLWRAWRIWHLVPGGRRNPTLWMTGACAVLGGGTLVLAGMEEVYADIGIPALILVTALAFALLQELQNGMVRTSSEPLWFDVVPADLGERTFIPPPDWPPPPPGWQPPPGWRPEPGWELPEGWRTWSRTGVHSAGGPGGVPSPAEETLPDPALPPPDVAEDTGSERAVRTGGAT